MILTEYAGFQITVTLANWTLLTFRASISINGLQVERDRSKTDIMTEEGLREVVGEGPTARVNTTARTNQHISTTMMNKLAGSLETRYTVQSHQCPLGNKHFGEGCYS